MKQSPGFINPDYPEHLSIKEAPLWVKAGTTSMVLSLLVTSLSPSIFLLARMMHPYSSINPLK